MDNAFSSSMAGGLAAAAVAMSGRAGAGVEIGLSTPSALGWDAMALFSDRAIVVRSRLEDDPAIEVGVMLAEEAVFTLAALTLKLGVFPEEMSEDVEMALGELATALIGGWNEAQLLPRMRWDGRAEVRRVDVSERATLGALLTERPTGLVGATLTVGGITYPFGVLGSLGWMPAVSRVVAPLGEVVAIEPEPAASAPVPGSEGAAVDALDPAPPSPPPPARSEDDGPFDVAFPKAPPAPFEESHGRSARPHRPARSAGPSAPAGPAGTSASVMIVDATGALSAWLSRQLESRAMALYHADPDTLREAGGATVLIVEADAALFAHLAPQQMVVMRRG